MTIIDCAARHPDALPLKSKVFGRGVGIAGRGAVNGISLPSSVWWPGRGAQWGVEGVLARMCNGRPRLWRRYIEPVRSKPYVVPYNLR